jgi:protein phosphatase
MEFIVGATTDQGRKRKQNQDSYRVVPEFGFFIVADGMGGHQGGETASQLAAETVSEHVKKIIQENKSWTPNLTLPQAIQAANQAIYQLSASEPKLHGMGTTTTALLFRERTLCIGQVGDSRCYLLRSHGFWQITRDHSLVEQKIRAGIISRAQAKTDQMKNIITRSVGFEPQVETELFTLEVQSGDTFLICSDGLSGLVDDSGLFQIIEESNTRGTHPQQITEALIQEANTKGGDDNITSVVVQVK